MYYKYLKINVQNILNLSLKTSWYFLTVTCKNIIFEFGNVYPPAREASREAANLTERKNPYTRIWCKRTCPSVCLLLQTLTPNISGLEKQNGLKFGL